MSVFLVGGWRGALLPLSLYWAQLLGELGAHRTVPWGSEPEPLPLTPGTLIIFSRKGCIYVESTGAHSKKTCPELGKYPEGICCLNGRNALALFCLCSTLSHCLSTRLRTALLWAWGYLFLSQRGKWQS